RNVGIGVGILFLGVLTFSIWDNFVRQKKSLNASSSPNSLSQSTSSVGLSPVVRGKRSPNAEANANLEKAALFMNSGFELQRARAFLERALELDPKFALARSTYALTDVLQVESGMSNDRTWIYKADQEAQRAMADDPEVAMANPVLGMICMYQGKGEE